MHTHTHTQRGGEHVLPLIVNELLCYWEMENQQCCLFSINCALVATYPRIYDPHKLDLKGQEKNLNKFGLREKVGGAGERHKYNQNI